MKTIEFKGTKIPLFNSPISENDLIKYNLKYDRFAVHDFKTGKVRLVSSNKPYSYNVRKIDIGTGIKYLVYGFTFFRLLSFKKQISKKIEPLKITINDIKTSKANFERDLKNYRKTKPVKPIKKQTAKA